MPTVITFCVWTEEPQAIATDVRPYFRGKCCQAIIYLILHSKKLAPCSSFLIKVIYLQIQYFLKKAKLEYAGFIYEGWSIHSFLFRKLGTVRTLNKFCDIHIEIKNSSPNWMLFEKQLWRRVFSMWSKDVVVVNRFSCVVSAKFEIFFPQ